MNICTQTMTALQCSLQLFEKLLSAHSLELWRNQGKSACSNHVQLETSVSDAFLQAIYAVLIDSLQPVIILAAFVFMLCAHFTLSQMNAYFGAVKATLAMVRSARATHPLCMQTFSLQGTSFSKSRFYSVDCRCLLPPSPLFPLPFLPSSVATCLLFDVSLTFSISLSFSRHSNIHPVMTK